VATLVLAALAIGWLMLLVAAPVAPTPLATLVYAAGSLICHQRPERSFHIDAAQLPVCARCLGVYAGAAAGVVSRLVAASRPSFGARTVLVVGVLPTVVTIALEWSSIWPAGNVVRCAAGLPLGLAAAFVLVPRLRVN
jgi:uncharacterized membrane protein